MTVLTRPDLQITDELLVEPKGPMAALEKMMHAAIDDYRRDVVLTDPSKQTVDSARLEVWVDGEPFLEVEDPSQLFEVDGRMPRLHAEKEVTVKAWVDNSSAAGFTPPTFVYLHLFHASLDMRMWIRLPMRMEESDNGPYWTLSWVVRHRGRERIAVDAIDAGSFATSDGDDYNANIWGIPYIIE